MTFDTFPETFWRWLLPMSDEEIEIKPNAKISISTALMIFLILQTIAGVWWGATITANLGNLTTSIQNSDSRYQKRLDDLEKKYDERDAEKNSRLNQQAKEIQTLREMYFLQFGRKAPAMSSN